MSGNSNKLIAFNYFGGKFTWADQIIPYFPPHRSFVDLFCGSMAVTLNKPVSALETANDLNGDVINFFKVLRNQPDELLTLLELTPVARDEYNSSWDIPAGVSDLERARCFYVRVRQSMYGLGIQERNKGWHICSHNDRTRKSQSVTRWNNALQKLGPVIGRLKNLQIENRDCLQVISMMDSPSTFFYCDPPYPKESRKSFDDYRYEFTDEKHEELAAALHQIKGQAMISGYDCSLMRSLYHDWEMVAFPPKNNNIRSGSVQECIWMNYDYTYGMNLFSNELIPNDESSRLI